MCSWVAAAPTVSLLREMILILVAAALNTAAQLAAVVRLQLPHSTL